MLSSVLATLTVVLFFPKEQVYGRLSDSNDNEVANLVSMPQRFEGRLLPYRYVPLPRKMETNYSSAEIGLLRLGKTKVTRKSSAVVLFKKARKSSGLKGDTVDQNLAGLTCVFANNVHTLKNVTCYTYKPLHDSVFSLERSLVPPTTQFSSLVTELALSVKMTGWDQTERAECSSTGPLRYCKGYDKYDCTSRNNKHDLMPIEERCGLTHFWTNFPVAGTENIHTCILMRYWFSSPFTLACYGPGKTFASASRQRSSEDFHQFAGIMSKSEQLGLLRAECVVLNQDFSCTGYSSDTCRYEWNGEEKKNYWECGARFAWTGVLDPKSDLDF